jgi:hypothetical protein
VSDGTLGSYLNWHLRSRPQKSEQSKFQTQYNVAFSYFYPTGPLYSGRLVHTRVTWCFVKKIAQCCPKIDHNGALLNLYGFLLQSKFWDIHDKKWQNIPIAYSKWIFGRYLVKIFAQSAQRQKYRTVAKFRPLWSHSCTCSLLFIRPI